MKMVHGLKMRALKLNSITFAIILFILAFIADAKTLKVDTLTPSVTDGNLLLQRNGTGEVTFGDYSGFCKFASGSPTCYANIDLTSHVTGILPIANGGTGTSSTTFVNAATNVTGVLPVANGGTNSSTALNNNFVMISSGGSIVEDANISTIELGYLNNVSSNLQTQLDAKVGDTGDESIAGLKTFTNLITASSAVTFDEIATPSTPSSGIKVYAKSDNKLYQLTDDGTEKKLGSGGGGEAGINFISDGSFEDSTLNPDSDGGGTESYQTYTADADLYSESNLQYFRVAYTGLSAADTYVRDSFARTALSGKQGFFSIWIKANADDFKVCVRVDDATFAAACDSALEHTIIGDSTWRKYEIPFVFGSATVQYEIYNESYTGDVNIEIDKVYVGTVPDGYIQTVGQASFVGSLTYASTNCVWQKTTTALGDYPVDSDCTASNINGNVQAPSTKIPGIKIPNARTDGYYLVTTQSLEYATSSVFCKNTLSSTGSYDNQGYSYSDSSDKTNNNLIGNFKFSTSGDKEIRIIGFQGDTSTCSVYGNDTDPRQFTVHFFPDSEANIVTQSTELPVVRGAGNGGTSLTASVTNIDFTEVEDNLSAWNGTQFTAPSTGFYLVKGIARFTTNTDGSIFSYIDGVLDKRLGFTITAENVHSFNGVVKLNKGEVLSLRKDTSVTLNTGTDHHIHIQKLPTDATIVGKFENINSSDLTVVRGESNGNNAVGTGAIIFTEVEDNKGAWDGSSFTAPRTALYHVSGMVASGSTSTSIRSYIDGVLDRRLGFTNTAATLHKFDGVILLQENEVLTIRSTASITLVAGVETHWITIQELPDTESIIKNLMTEQYPKARYTSDANTQSIPSATRTVIGFEDKDYDSHNAVSGSGTSWKFTVPTNAGGVYRVSSVVHIGSPSGATLCVMGLLKNGTLYGDGALYPVISTELSCAYSGTVNLAAGDYISMTAFHNEGSNLTLASGGITGRIRIEIERIQ